MHACNLFLWIGVTAKSPSSPSAGFVWISDKDMTEIELHSVDSINDLHRTNTEHHSKGITHLFSVIVQKFNNTYFFMGHQVDIHCLKSHPIARVAGIRPPRPQPPTINGQIQMTDRPVVYQTARPGKKYHLNQLNNICSSTTWCYYLSCIVVILNLLTLIVICSFLGEFTLFLKHFYLLF